MLAVTSITYFFAADVKCSLYEINKNNRANATHELSPVQKMFSDLTKAMWTREVQEQDLDYTEQGLTSHQTHYRSYQGRVFMGQMTKPIVSKHWKKEQGPGAVLTLLCNVYYH